MNQKQRKIIGVVGLVLGLGLLAILFANRYFSPTDVSGGTTVPIEMEQLGAGGDVEDEVSEVPADAGNEDGVIAGRVLRPNDEPAANARVVLYSAGDEEPTELQADPSGMFRVADLPTRLFVVEASAPGYGQEIVIGVLPGGAPLRLVLNGGRTVEGRVLGADGAPAEAVVHVGGAGMFPQASSRTQGDGTFELSGLRPGRYEYVAVSAREGSAFGGSFTLDSDGVMTPRELVVELDRAPESAFEFIDRSNGVPVDIAVATISAQSVHVLALNEIAREGVAVIDYLPPGEYWLRVRAPGYLPYSQKFWIRPDGADQQILLTRGARICGKVVDPVGNPIPQASLRAAIETTDGGRFDLATGLFESFHRLAQPSGAPFLWPTSDYRSAQDGTYCVAGLPSGTATVSADATGWTGGSSGALQIVEGQVYDDITITLRQGGSVRGRVEDQNGDPVAGATVSAINAAAPQWRIGTSELTDRDGLFRFDNVAASLRLRVRHPDYEPWEKVIEVPESGVDDYVVTLDGDSAVAFIGRVLTTNDGPAVGARVWLMRGGVEVPVCRAITDQAGMFRATECSAEPDRILIRHDGHAPFQSDLGSDSDERDWVLRAGGEIDVVSQRFPVSVRVAPSFVLPEGIWPRPALELDRWSREQLPHVAPGEYSVVCSTEGRADVTVNVSVTQGARVEAVCPIPGRVQDFRLYVVDRQGAPVRGAIVSVPALEPPFSGVTGDDGYVDLTASPGSWARAVAMHEDWGQGTLNFQSPTEAIEPLRLELVEPVGGDDDETLRLLGDWGVEAIRDNMSLVVSEIGRDSPAANTGLRRRDRLVWVRELSDNRLSLGVRRSGDVITFDLRSSE